MDGLVQKKASPIRLLVSDVDGCWTDGKVTLDGLGGELVTFDIHDGYGIYRLLKAGIEVAIISGRKNPAVAARMQKLGVTEVHLGSLEKGPTLEALLQSRQLRPSQVAAFGDDLPDLALFERAGLCFAPANARPEVATKADYVTNAPGGSGALREICDLLLASREAVQRTT